MASRTATTRTLLALVLGVIAALFIAGPVAAAEEGEPDVSHAVHECVELMETENSIDVECQEAPSPILPETNEIIWGAFGFVIVFAFLFWKGVPAIKKTMDERTEKIRGEIEGAEAAKVEADKVLAEYHSQLADARNEAARILEEARQDADAVKAERIAAIEPELAEMRTRAAAEIESSKAQALSELRGEITAIALGAAERVVERNLDDATNRALIDSYIDSVGAQS
jgi:F-type H+-transporting ATPase subunit b